MAILQREELRSSYTDRLHECFKTMVTGEAERCQLAPCAVKCGTQMLLLHRTSGSLHRF